ncbi:hypothetical protein D1151_16145 [Emergencia sp. 1XD21-10]|nr:hypothetical protein [Emergencia sp. 1XD21-10]
MFGHAANTLGVVGEAALKADNFVGKQMISLNIIPAIVLKAFSCERYFAHTTTVHILRMVKLGVTAFFVKKRSVRGKDRNVMGTL